MLENSLRVFMNLYQARQYCGKLIYIGSGAEYDKTQDICEIDEDKCFCSAPKDIYGFAKYIMNSLTDKSENVYNLCLFACYGPGDDASKFITHCIRCCLGDEPITIRQDCRFDYLHVYDLAPMMIWLVENVPQHHIYNACSGKGVLLSEIAQEVCRQMGNTSPIQIIKIGMNQEYTCSNERFTKESGIYPLITLSEGIKMQINWEMKNWQEKA
jgi:GDP-L-fucose synthase